MQNRWKKLAASIAVVAVLAGAGIAQAQGRDNAPDPTAAPVPDGTRALGAGTTEMKFVPVTPCRLVDTRAAGGKLASLDTRRWDVRGTGASFAAQGGKANGCGIPNSGVSAVEVTVTAVSATGKGFVRVYPEAEPTATFLNYTNVFDAGNTGTVGLCGFSGGICILNNDISVRNFTSSTHIVIDVQGYYQLPIAASIDFAGSINRSSRTVSATRTGAGTYSVVFDRNVTSCSYTGIVGNPTDSSPNGTINISPLLNITDGVFVQTRQADGVASDRPFYVEVTC